MKCLNAAEITTILDRELSPVKEKQAQQHIETCSRCSQLYEQISIEKRYVIGLYQARSIPQTELSFPRNRPDNRHSNRFHSLAWAASFLVAIIAWVTITLFRPPQTRNRTMDSQSACLVQTGNLSLLELSVQGMSAEPFLYEEPALQTTFVWAASASRFTPKGE